MLQDIAEFKNRDLLTPKYPIDVAFAEEAGTVLYIQVPPASELEAIRQLSREQISFRDFEQQGEELLKKSFDEEFKRALSKHQRYRSSRTHLTRLANLASLAGDDHSAEEFLRQALALNGGAPQRVRLGDVLVRQHRISEAQDQFRQASSTLTVDANIKLAYLAILQRDFEEARERALAALQANPLNYRVNLFLGTLSLTELDFGVALRHFRVAIEENPRSSIAHVNLAVAHLCMRRPDKALIALKKAVQNDPLNSNALLFFADLSSMQKRAESALDALRFYLKFDEKNERVWERAARAYFEAGQLHDARRALEHQAAIRDSAGTWNNLGVVLGRLGQVERALQFLELARKQKGEGSHLALVNQLRLLFESGQTDRLCRIAEREIGQDTQKTFLSDPALADIYGLYLNALYRRGSLKSARGVAQVILDDRVASNRTRLMALVALISDATLHERDIKAALHYAKRSLEILDVTDDCDERLRAAVMNNVMFALLEGGELAFASKLYREIERAVGKEPYQTATAGLYFLLRGNIKKGTALYEKAAQLTAREDRTRFRQKMNLEIGRALLRDGRQVAARAHLARALRASGGLNAAATEARELEQSIRRKLGSPSKRS